jgi:hypothetical protein
VSVIKIKLSKILSPIEFKVLQNDLWEYFGDINKEDIELLNRLPGGTGVEGR